MGFRGFACLCQLLRGIYSSSGSIIDGGGWDPDKSDPNLCRRLAIRVLIKSTLQRVDDAIAS